MSEKDYPEIGVCSWKAWSQEAACYIVDPKRGNFPERLLGSGYHFALRMVRSRPYGANPWRRCFARYAMTPREAALTIKGDDPNAEADWLLLARKWHPLLNDNDRDGGLGVPA